MKLFKNQQRNIEGVKTLQVGTINVYDLLKTQKSCCNRRYC